SGRALLPPAAGSRVPVRPGWKYAAVAAALTAASALFWIFLGRHTAAPAREFTLTRLTHDVGLALTPAISADGRLLAYASDRAEGNLDIWVQQVSGGDAVRLTRDAADESEPSFSPDGSRIAFSSLRGGGGIYTISSLGG